MRRDATTPPTSWLREVVRWRSWSRFENAEQHSPAPKNRDVPGIPA